MDLFLRHLINKHKWRGQLAAYLTLDHSPQKFHQFYQFLPKGKQNKSVWYIDIQVLVSRKEIPHILPVQFHIKCPFPLVHGLCNKKIQFTPSLRPWLAKCISLLFPAATHQITPFPEHARWNVHMCETWPSTYTGSECGAPTSPSCK